MRKRRNGLAGMLRLLKLCVLPVILLALSSTALADYPYVDESAYAQVIDVTDFGADGSDGLADADAINQALLSAAAVDGGTLVRVPAGTYRINKNLTILGDTTLLLDGNAVMLRDPALSVMLINIHLDGGEICYRADCPHGGYSQTENVRVIGGVWDGNAQESGCSKDNCVMAFGHGSGFEIRDTVLRNTCGLHMLLLNSMQNVTINGVSFRDMLPMAEDGRDSRSDREWFEIASGREAVQIDFPEPGVDATYPYDGTMCRGITIENCSFENVQSVAGSHHENGNEKHSGFTFRNNTVAGVWGSVVDAWAMDGLNVTGNTVVDAPLFLLASASAGTVSGNTVQADWLARLSNGCDVVIGDESYTITDRIPLAGYALQAVGSTLTLRNTDLSLPYDGVNATGGSTLTIENCALSAAGGGTCVQFYSSAGAVKNSVLSSGAGGSPLVIWGDGRTGVSVEDNEISGGGSAVLIGEAGAGTVVRGNVISGFSDNGVYVADSEGVAVTDNTMPTGSGATGFGVNCLRTTGGVISGNTITGLKEGVRASRTNGLTVEGNVVQGCADNGLMIQYSTDIDVRENTAVHTGGMDIFLWDCSGVCTENTVTEDVGRNIVNGKETVSAACENNYTLATAPKTPGDLTGDGRVNTADLLRLVKYLTDRSIFIVGSADVNGDSESNAGDLIHLLRYVNGQNVTLF